MSNIQSGGIDFDKIFMKYTTGSRASVTNIKSSIYDLSEIYQPYTNGAYSNSTGVKSKNKDLSTIFQNINSPLVPFAVSNGTGNYTITNPDQNNPNLFLLTLNETCNFAVTRQPSQMLTILVGGGGAGGDPYWDLTNAVQDPGYTNLKNSFLLNMSGATNSPFVFLFGAGGGGGRIGYSTSNSLFNINTFYSATVGAGGTNGTSYYNVYNSSSYPYWIPVSCMFTTTTSYLIPSSTPWGTGGNTSVTSVNGTLTANGGNKGYYSARDTGPTTNFYNNIPFNVIKNTYGIYGTGTNTTLENNFPGGKGGSGTTSTYLTYINGGDGGFGGVYKGIYKETVFPSQNGFINYFEQKIGTYNVKFGCGGGAGASMSHFDATNGKWTGYYGEAGSSTSGGRNNVLTISNGGGRNATSPGCGGGGDTGASSNPSNTGYVNGGAGANGVVYIYAIV
jgi:hypothetical protein